MRYIAFFLLHLISIAAVFTPMVIFALPNYSERLPLANEGLFLGLAIYWCFAPCLIGIVSGMGIDGISRAWSSENHYDKAKWSRTRRRVVFMTLLGGGLVYLHFLLAPSS